MSSTLPYDAHARLVFVPKKGKTLLEFLATRIDTAIDNDFTLYLSVNYLVYSLLVDK